MPEFIRLWRTKDDLDPVFGLDFSTQMTICTKGPDGKPCLISKRYVDSLRAGHWRGVDDIPVECIVEDPS